MSGTEDPAGLGRYWLTRWMPVLGQAPNRPPAVEPITVRPGTGPTRFLVGVLFSAKRYTLPAVVLGMLWQAGEAVVPVVMGAAIDEALAEGDVSRLLLWIGVLAVVFIVISLSFRFTAQLSDFATEIVSHRFRITLSRRLLHTSGSTGSAPDAGVVSLMTNDIMRVAGMRLAVYPVAEFSGVVFIAVALLLIHWLLGLIVLVGAPLTVWLMGVLSGRLARDSRVYQTLLATTVGRATDMVTGYRVIKGIRAEAEATERYRETSRETLDGAFRNVAHLGRFLVGSTTVSGAFVAGVAALAAWFAIKGQISVGGLIAAVGLSQALLPPMRMLAMNAVPGWAAAHGSGARILDALTSTEAGGRGNVEEPILDDRDSVAGEMVVRDDGRIPAADGAAGRIDLRVGRRETVAIEAGETVGISADEVCAAKIAEAFLRPGARNDVSLSIDGLDHTSPDFEHRWHEMVIVSPHHATLFSGSVAETIRPPDADVDEGPGRRDLGTAALLAAACDDFISAEETETHQIGEMANQLSGGQRQRLALARAYATDAPVLVLHDPTAAVDSVTEQAISARLREIRRGRTTILIASSPVLLGVCDRVVDLEIPQHERTVSV
ncbi:ABC transporter transmembrane domain-containing protein [Brevibacterium atlanticum]|uniref:ABC transporter transmembrane domain-containing protein n=1 Tax=Brevibacterium atlanticum TaxID=2697563 RepID=UPI001AA1A5BB|nr:ABC transporter ATP-binding protein [Brevibacterium atlanticum]